MIKLVSLALYAGAGFCLSLAFESASHIDAGQPTPC